MFPADELIFSKNLLVTQSDKFLVAEFPLKFSVSAIMFDRPSVFKSMCIKYILDGIVYEYKDNHMDAFPTTVRKILHFRGPNSCFMF